MATKTLSENINQAISDFNSIKQAIIDKGVEIPSGTKTSEYGAKIGEIQGGGGGLDTIGVTNFYYFCAIFITKISQNFKIQKQFTLL